MLFEFGVSSMVGKQSTQNHIHSHSIFFLIKFCSLTISYIHIMYSDCFVPQPLLFIPILSNPLPHPWGPFPDPCLVGFALWYYLI